MAPQAAGLPLLVDDWSLAFQLNLSGKTLWYLTKERETQYKLVTIPKATGGVRLTWNPSSIMRNTQEKIRRALLTPLTAQLGPHVAAYRDGKSTLDAVTQHMRFCGACHIGSKPGQQPVAHLCKRQGTKFKMDLKDFFLSTKATAIRRYFQQKVGYGKEVSSMLATLMTLLWKDPNGRTHEGVPPGSLTAGDICNLVADWLLDQPLMEKLVPLGWRYTRYADDLYFSHDERVTPEQLREALAVVRICVRDAGYRVNEKKTQIQRWERPQQILGFSLNRKVNIPSQVYERLHGDLYNLEKHGWDYCVKRHGYESAAEAYASYVGKLNYYKKVAPHKVEKLRKLLDAALLKYPLEILKHVAFERD